MNNAKHVGILGALSGLFSMFGKHPDIHGGLGGGYTKFKYAGLSKNSPSHAQQKRNSIKRKNKQGK